MGWQDKKEVRIGNYGENLCINILETNGYVIYKPITAKSHKIDFFAHKNEGKDLFCVEIKTKRRLAITPMTGFGINSYKHYKEITDKHNIEVIVMFVDKFEKCIYGGLLSKLGKPSKMSGGGENLVVFNLSNMVLIKKLTKEEIFKLESLSGIDNKYEYVKPYFKVNL